MNDQKTVCKLHIEVDADVRFSELGDWGDSDKKAYAEQVGHDMIRVPEYARNQVDMSDACVSVHVEIEK